MTNQSKAAKRESLKTVFATIIAFVLVFVIFTSTAFADVIVGTEVRIQDENKTIAVTTNETEPIAILESAGITLGAQDKLDTSNYEKGEGGIIEIQRPNNIRIKRGAAADVYTVYSNTVGEALEEAGKTLGVNDKLNCTVVDPVTEGMLIVIKPAFKVRLVADGYKATFSFADGTVSDLLKLAGIKLGKHDYTKPAVNKKLKKGMTVKLYRVEYKKTTRTEKIAYKTVRKKDNTLDYGKKVVKRKGKKGVKKLYYRDKYINGKRVKRTKTGEEITKKPVNKIVKIGTKSNLPAGMKPNGVQSMNGFTLGQVINGRATRYCCCVKCCGNTSGYTASGKRVHNGMKDPYYIACNWLPMGTVVEVFGNVYTVVDRGGSGLSRIGAIDIYTPQGHEACFHMQAGACTIKILRLGW